MAMATVTSKGQITIPAAVRDELGLHPGSRVSFVRTDDGVYEFRPQSQSIASLKGVIPRRGSPVSLDEMADAVFAGAGGRLEA